MTNNKPREITYLRKKPAFQISEERMRKVNAIYSEFFYFADGYRVLFLIHRNKEGGETNNSKVRKIITRNRQEWYDAVIDLVNEQAESKLPLRIYASLNERNFKKAIRQFKFEQLEADYYDEEQKDNFYLDVKNRFIGCLMQPQQAKTSYFLFDCDDVEGRDVHGEMLSALNDGNAQELIITQYKTKNGWHIITNPFNYTTIKMPDGVEMKKDGLILLAY